MKLINAEFNLASWLKSDKFTGFKVFVKKLHSFIEAII